MKLTRNPLMKQMSYNKVLALACADIIIHPARATVGVHLAQGSLILIYLASADTTLLVFGLPQPGTHVYQHFFSRGCKYLLLE